MSTKATNSDPPTDDSVSGAARKGGRLRALLLGAGVLAPIALGGILSLAALPKKEAEEQRSLVEPYVAELSPSTGFQVNLADTVGEHYLALSIKAEVESYAADYISLRESEPLYRAQVSDAVLRAAAAKTEEELDDPVEKENFRSELCQALELVLFPVHVGSAASAQAADPESGLLPGFSARESRLEGLFYEHRLKVNAAARSIRLDDGPVTAFQGNEHDLAVCDARGASLYLDVTGLYPDFEGEVHVGSMGRIRTIYYVNFLTQ